jgi:hypothetical protein
VTRARAPRQADPDCRPPDFIVPGERTCANRGARWCYNDTDFYTLPRPSGAQRRLAEGELSQEGGELSQAEGELSQEGGELSQAESELSQEEGDLSHGRAEAALAGPDARAGGSWRRLESAPTLDVLYTAVSGAAIGHLVVDGGAFRAAPRSLARFRAAEPMV